MISEMAPKLKEILSETSQEEFDRDWAEIEKSGFQGPHANEIVAYFKVISDLNNQSTGGDS